jgi:hypothetical protein
MGVLRTMFIREHLYDRLFFSLLLAYPIAGAVCTIVGYFTEVNLDAKAVWVIPIMAAGYAIFTTAYVGFPPADEAGLHYKNMYPWIIPTALVLFASTEVWLRVKRTRLKKHNPWTE